MDLRFFDFHTHSDHSSADVAILNCYPSAFLTDRPDSDKVVSVGLHPWHVASDFRAHMASLASVLQLPQVVAVGECGLDKLCDSDFALQNEAFDMQMRMAAVVGKPVIVHCVKAYDELFALMSRLQSLPPAVVVHGFRGKPQLARQLVSHGCILSFGPKFNADTLLALASSPFLIETDDSGVDVREVYSLVADVIGGSVSDLCRSQSLLASRLFGL